MTAGTTSGANRLATEGEARSTATMRGSGAACQAPPAASNMSNVRIPARYDASARMRYLECRMDSVLPGRLEAIQIGSRGQGSSQGSSMLKRIELNSGKY